MTFPSFPVEFRKDGSVFDESQVDALLAGAAGATDVFVASHGWNNDIAEAQALYDELFGNMARQASSGVVPQAAGRRFVVMQVFWPSKKFADTDLIPGGGAASANAESDGALERLLEEMKNVPDRLGRRSEDAARSAALDRAKALIPKLDHDPAARDDFVEVLRGLVKGAEHEPDDGSDAFLQVKPNVLFTDLGEPVPAVGGIGQGGAAGLSGGAAGLGDLLRGAKAAARRLANFVTYYEMKDRAGTVGRKGVADVLRRIRGRHPQARLHLVGHSFGGRLVTAAAHALADNNPGVTLALLQAAFSHNGLAVDYDNRKNNGYFRAVVASRRASGPIVITHTKNDRAVGIAYPLASRIAFQKAAALGDANDPYGGMGRNGAQHTPEVASPAQELGKEGTEYRFEPGRVYNLRADRFVKSHGDVSNAAVAYAVLRSATSA